LLDVQVRYWTQTGCALPNIKFYHHESYADKTVIYFEKNSIYTHVKGDLRRVIE